MSSWSERQGRVGDLRNLRKEELLDLLLRQETILSNRSLLRTLPDKGKKIQEFTEKLRAAVDLHNEEERRQGLASASRTELMSQHNQTLPLQQHAVSTAGTSSYPSGGNEDAAKKVEIDSSAANFLTPSDTKEVELVEAMNRVTVSETDRDNNNQLDHKAQENYFLQKHPDQTPHFKSVLENGNSLSAYKKRKFKLNQLPQTVDVSTSVYSESLSAQARKEQERKYLDDITAAKLPPLLHSPAQLLTLEESANLLTEQARRQQELQAKAAAQKLSEGLKISMESYCPDGGSVAAYREVQDEGVQVSSDED